MKGIKLMILGSMGLVVGTLDYVPYVSISLLVTGTIALVWGFSSSD